MGLLDRFNEAFGSNKLTLEQERTLDQLQANRAKAAYLIPQDLWKEFMKSIFPDECLKKLAVEVAAASGKYGPYRVEYLRGHLDVCLMAGSFDSRLIAGGVDPKRVSVAMLEKIVLPDLSQDSLTGI